MKTAEEFAGENDGFTILRNDHRSIELIESILAQGMRDAAEIVSTTVVATVVTSDRRSTRQIYKDAIMDSIKTKANPC